MNARDYMNWPFCHDLMALVISDLYPGLVHGRDFMVAHPVDPETGGPGGDPFLVSWKPATTPKPTDDYIKSKFEADERRYRTLFVRAFRDECLAWSDAKVTTPADAPATMKTSADVWRAYRQALRDIPAQLGFPFDIEWPDLPANGS